MANATVFDSTLTSPGGTGSTITVTLPTHALGDIIYISIGNTGSTLWTGNPAGWNRITQVQVGTSANGLLGTWFWRKVVSGDSLPLASPVFTLGATVSRMAIARSVRGPDLESPFVLPEWVARAYNTGTANPVRPTAITTPAPETLVLHDYFSKAATNAPDPSGYSQDEEIIISGTLVGNGAEKVVADQQTALSNQDASPTSGVRWVAGIIAIPSPDYVYYRVGSQALTASGTSATPALPTGTSASDNRGNKDLVIATIEVSGTPTISPQVGADWTEIATWANTTSGNGSTIKKYWSLFDGSLNTQFNRSTTGEIFVYLSTYRNTKQTNPIGTSAVQQNASSTTSPFPSIARTATKVNMQATCVADATPTYTSPATWTERNDSNGVTCADLPFNATGTVSSASFTLSAGSPTLAGLTEIKSVASVVEFNRSALVDGAGAVVVAGTFFTIFTRTALIDAANSVTVSGVRIVSRETSVGVTGNIATSGTVVTPFNTVERSVAVNASVSIESSSTFFSVFDRASDVDGVGAIVTSATFFTVFDRSSLVDGVGSVSSVGARDLLRTASIDASGAIASTPAFFSVFDGSATVEGIAAIASASTFFSVFERNSELDGSASIASTSTFFTTFENATSLNATVSVDTSAISFSVFAGDATLSGSASIDSAGEFFSVVQSTSLTNCTVSITSAGIVIPGSVTFERTVLFDVAATIESSGIFWSVIERTATVDVSGVLTVTGARNLLRAALVGVTAEIETSGVRSVGQFHPQGLGRVGGENRIQPISRENRRI